MQRQAPGCHKKCKGKGPYFRLQSVYAGGKPNVTDGESAASVSECILAITPYFCYRKTKDNYHVILQTWDR